MTQAQLNAGIKQLLRMFEARIAKATPDQQREMRERLRDDRKLIFVRTYTVHAHFRPARGRGKAKTYPTRGLLQ